MMASSLPMFSPMSQLRSIVIVTSIHRWLSDLRVLRRSYRNHLVSKNSVYSFNLLVSIRSQQTLATQPTEYYSSTILSNPLINARYFFCAFATVVSLKRILLLFGMHCASRGKSALATVPILG